MWDVGDKGERHSLISFVRRLPALPARGRKAPWTKSSIFHRLSPATQVSFPRFQALGAFAKETFIHLLSAASIISGIALTGTWCAPGIREGGGAGPVAGGNAAGNFHPRPGPVSRLPRTGKGHRGGPDDRARPPAGRSQGAIHLLYEALTQRPASRLPQKLDAKAGVEMERLAFSHIKGSEGEEPPCNQTIPQQGKRVNPSSMPCEMDRQD